MKKIRLAVFASLLHNTESVINSRSELFSSIKRYAELEIAYPSMLAAANSTTTASRYSDWGVERTSTSVDEENGEQITVYFIATGGTEEIFTTYLDSIPKPVILLSDGLHNSFAAAMEISTYLERAGIKCSHFNAPLDYSDGFFSRFISIISDEGRMSEMKSSGVASTDAAHLSSVTQFPKSVMHTLAKYRIGLLGGASSWLISSDIDRESVSERYGVEFVDIDLSELEKRFFRIETPDRHIMARMERFLSAGRSMEDLAKAAQLYGALRSLCDEMGIRALTIKCFDILDRLKTTACLALALLNDEGVVSGCEGDVPALWTMIYANLALGRQAFMANPSSSNPDELTVDFAHCTVPLKMTHGFRLPSHFESGIGIGIAGSIPCGRYTLLKISGRNLQDLYKVSGSVIMNTNVPQRCRTQLRFQFDNETDFRSFFTTAKGNHIILVAE